MPIEILAIAFLSGMLLAIFIGLPVAIALGSVGLLGLYYVGGTKTVIIMTGSTAIHELCRALPLRPPRRSVASFCRRCGGADTICGWASAPLPSAARSAF
jgi:hypothetical protein